MSYDELLFARRHLAARLGMAGIGAALASALLLTSGDAAATITLGPPQVTNGTANPNRPASAAYWISYEDCLNNLAFAWTVTATEAFSVAASAEGTCPQPTGTTTTSLQSCWQVPNASGLTSGATVTLRAQDLVQGALGITNCDPTTAPAGVTWPQPVTVFFYASDSVGEATDSVSWTQTEITLEGPAPPTPTLGDGDGELVVELPGNAGADVQGYYIYCYPVGPGAEGAADGGPPSNCPAGTAIPALDVQHPDPYSPYVCASQVPVGTTSYTLDSLKDGQVYAVAVMAYDAVGNIGPLSPLECATPVALPPGAGGHGCAFRGVDAGDAGAPVLGLAGLLGLAAVARRRRGGARGTAR